MPMNFEARRTSVGCVASNDRVKVTICDGYFYTITKDRDGKALNTPKKVFKEIPGHTVSVETGSGDTYIPLPMQDGSITLKKVTVCKIVKKVFRQKDGRETTIITECPDLGNVSDKDALDIFVKLS